MVEGASEGPLRANRRARVGNDVLHGDHHPQRPGARNAGEHPARALFSPNGGRARGISLHTSPCRQGACGFRKLWHGACSLLSEARGCHQRALHAAQPQNSTGHHPRLLGQVHMFLLLHFSCVCAEPFESIPFTYLSLSLSMLTCASDKE